jgi:hypothetical protein
VPKKSYFLEKSDFSNRVPKRAQKMTKKSVPKKSYFLEKSDFSTAPKHAKKNDKEILAQEIRFLGKIGFLLKKPNL